MNKLLIVVDYQNDFVNGSLGFEGAEKLDEGISKLIDSFDGHIVATMDTHDKDYLDSREGKSLPIKHCIKGTLGWEIYGKTKDSLSKKYVHLIEKTTFAPDLSTLYLPLHFDRIELVGLVTNICVLSTAIAFQAKYPEAQIVVHKNLTDSFDKELKEKSFTVMQGIQIQIKED